MPHEPLPLPTILMADDDLDDRLMTEHALGQVWIARRLTFVDDGQDLMDYLRQTGPYGARPEDAPRPELLLLDLNMPRKDGRAALAEIKADPALRCIPIVVLTTSQAEEDILRTYDLGVSSFITKPSSYKELVDVMDAIRQYWFSLVRLPGQKNEASHEIAPDPPALD